MFRKLSPTTPSEMTVPLRNHRYGPLIKLRIFDDVVYATGPELISRRGLCKCVDGYAMARPVTRGTRFSLCDSAAIDSEQERTASVLHSVRVKQMFPFHNQDSFQFQRLIFWDGNVEHIFGQAQKNSGVC